MAHAYTPGLTVTEQTVIRKRRLLPIPGTVLAAAGDRVHAETVVARAELPGKVHVVNVANLLGIAPDKTLSAAQLLPTMKSKIVVGGAFLGIGTMKQAREIGVAGLVVGGIHDKDLRELLGYDLGVAITGTEQVGFTLVITEGFGTIPMAAKTFELLAGHAGQKASISGARQIRAGVIRPEILIPWTTGSPDAGLAGRVVPATERSGIRIDDHVRVIRDPLFGRIGRVTALPTELRQIETESVVRVLVVTFADGTSAVIPRANVELMEG